MGTADSISLVGLRVLQLTASNRQDQAEEVKKYWQTDGASHKVGNIPRNDCSSGKMKREKTKHSDLKAKEKVGKLFQEPTNEIS